MKYVGIQTQISRNNTRSILLLLAFPTLILGMMYAVLFLVDHFSSANKKINTYYNFDANEKFFHYLPYVVLVVGLWFIIAYFAHTTLIKMATGAHTLERKNDKRVYNLVENLCIQEGMPMPKVCIIEDDSLNAFASGINKESYTVSLSRGIINKLDDKELEAVIAHELTHIKNKDVRLLIISIIFVGIFAFLTEMFLRQVLYSVGRRKNEKDNIIATLAILAIVSICYFFSIIIRFSLSRSREYMADAGAAEMTKRPYALASALSKIKGDPLIESVKNRDVAQLFIENPQIEKKSFWDNLFATHPPIDKRIELLKQYA